MVETLLTAIKPTKQKQHKAAIQQNTIYWGESEAMAKLKALIEKVAATDANILITGRSEERRVGKEC